MSRHWQFRFISKRRKLYIDHGGGCKPLRIARHASLSRMSRRSKYLLLVLLLSLLMWGGIISGSVWLISDGTDYSFTAGTH